MQRTHILTGLAASVGTLTIAAAFGFRQPDGLNPPAGPVVDTSPSLSDLADLLATCGGGNNAPSLVSQFTGVNFGTQVVLSVGNARVERVIMQKGFVEVTDSAGFSLTLEAAREVTSTNNTRPIDAFTYELNVDVAGPLTFASTSTTNEADFIVVYKELP